jgi:hypothetical protein
VSGGAHVLQHQHEHPSKHTSQVAHNTILLLIFFSFPFYPALMASLTHTGWSVHPHSLQSHTAVGVLAAAAMAANHPRLDLEAGILDPKINYPP